MQRDQGTSLSFYPPHHSPCSPALSAISQIERADKGVSSEGYEEEKGKG